jgi:molecular chaperone HtpG
MTGKFEVDREKIRLYSRQVFITDNLKDVVPDFLSLLHGVIDSPDIPLNVSRSALQSDSAVKKIGGYITRKVADKLQELFTNDRPGYEAKWEAIGFFVKYGLVAEPKFAERAKAFTLLKSTDEKLYTIEEYREKTLPIQTDKDDMLVWLYTPDAARQAAFMAPLTARGYDVLDMSHPIDSHYVSHLEQIVEKVKIKRIDSATAEELIAKGEASISVLSDDEKTKLQDIFSKELGEKITVKTADLQTTDLPAALVQDEFMLRMAEMMRLQGQTSMFGDMPGQLVINANHPVMATLLSAEEADAGKKARHLYQLALLAQGKLEGTALSEFISASANMMA